MVYDIDTDIGILFISPNPAEFGSWEAPFYGVFVKLTQEIGNAYLNLLAHV